MNLIEHSKPTLKVDKTLKSFFSMQRNTGKSAKNQKRIRWNKLGLTVVYSLLQKMHFTDPLQPLPEYRSVLSRKTSYQENGNIQQKCKKRSVFLFIVHF